MKKIIKINPVFSKVEFWAANTIFAFVLFFFILNALNGDNALQRAPNKAGFDQAGIPFHFYQDYFFPQLARHIGLFLALLFLNFIVIPGIIRKHRLALNIVLVAVVFILLAFVFGIADSYGKGFLYAGAPERSTVNQLIFRDGLWDALVVYGLLAAYTILKYLSIYLIDIAGTIQARYSFIRKEGVVASIIWVFGLLVFVLAELPGLLIAGWIIAVPSAILLYLAGFYILIPSSINKKYPFIIYALKNGLILFIILMAWGLILKLVVGGDMAHLAALWIFNSVLQMCTTIPITWALYKRHMKGNEQLNVLRKELGQSTASFDFLRSQINPHFLFNALNTLYGTAIQEKAERTSEGIEKLGEMMRFMLRENMQEKIALAREINYLDNYISLQRLRTDPSPGVQIQTEIQADAHNFQIAPMLLIPFVENAFKHGISLREPSHIKITLEINENTLYFMVYNTRHVRTNNDPEKDKSGIGLENVKQRLNLLYPGKHKLITRDTEKEYFIHLTVVLAPQ